MEVNPDAVEKLKERFDKVLVPRKLLKAVHTALFDYKKITQNGLNNLEYELEDLLKEEE